MLLENGANVNDTDINSNTALHWACYYGRINTIKLLLPKSILTARNTHGETALHWAVICNTYCSFTLRKKIVKQLISYSANSYDTDKKNVSCYEYSAPGLQLLIKDAEIKREIYKTKQERDKWRPNHLRLIVYTSIHPLYSIHTYLLSLQRTYSIVLIQILLYMAILLR